MKHRFTRALALPPAGTETFFLWGPRQTGKSTLLREHYPDARWVDLLKADDFRRYASRPELLRQELEAEAVRDGTATADAARADAVPTDAADDVAVPRTSRQIVVDEVQKVPALLDEAQWLMERYGYCFALCGSSARRVRRGGANLLGGRALRYELRGVTARELDQDFELDRILNHGYLPRIYRASRPGRLLDAYVGDYLKEEVAAEGLVRNIPRFSHFLEAAALCDGQVVNFANIARECGVSGHTARSHFEVLEDTLLGAWLPAYRKRAKRRVVHAPKFYFSDVGVVNRLARRGEVLSGSAEYGKAFENWVHHELAAYLGYRKADVGLSYWRLAGGTEVDFVLGDIEVALEAKSSRNVVSDHLKGLRSLVRDHPAVRRRVVVCREPRRRRTRDGIEIVPARQFAVGLWEGEWL